jgi:hypothetical protein
VAPFITQFHYYKNLVNTVTDSLKMSVACIFTQGAYQSSGGRTIHLGLAHVQSDGRETR